MNSIDYKQKGIVFNIQRFSLHDGPGIRTIVFLKGCPLSCRWCCNPESQSISPIIMFEPKRCISCGKCLTACKQGAISKSNKFLVDRTKCINSGDCAAVCPAGALVLKGEEMTVEQVIKELKKDEITYRRSGGGITLSGGEPLLQSEFATELLKACKAKGWHTAMETTAFTTSDKVEKVFPYVDLVLLDIKGINDEIHKAYTGVSNQIIHKNARRISEITKTVVRVPTIPGVNANKTEIKGICELAKSLNNVKTIHLLPYHTYGDNKYQLLGMEYTMKDVKPLAQSEIDELKETVLSQGLECVIGG